MAGRARSNGKKEKPQGPGPETTAPGTLSYKYEDAGLKPGVTEISKREAV